MTEVYTLVGEFEINGGFWSPTKIEAFGSEWSTYDEALFEGEKELLRDRSPEPQLRLFKIEKWYTT